MSLYSIHNVIILTRSFCNLRGILLERDEIINYEMNKTMRI